MADRSWPASLPDVSRETWDRLVAFSDLASTWTQRINLVAPKSVSELWTRHILDSAQVFAVAPRTPSHWIDMGSGGGFPGLIVAILAKEIRPDLAITLVESDKRKAAFLMTASRELDLNTQILAQRVEALTPTPADVISARALAPLTKLMHWAHPWTAPHTRLIFPKGATADTEIAQAQEHWAFTVRRHASITDATGTILDIGDLSRA